MNEKIAHSLGVSTDQRRLFVSKNGHIGLAPAKTEPGDLIFAIKGCRTPHTLRMVLEKREDSDTDPCNSPFLKDRFRLVGDCYLDGFMDSRLDDLFREQPEVFGNSGWHEIDIV
jgi:hypothetical protein